jgi:hypothetical protein
MAHRHGHGLEVEPVVREQHAERKDQAAAGGGRTLQLEAVDRRQHVLLVVGRCLNDGGGAGKGHDAEPHGGGQFVDEGLGGILRGHQAVGLDIGRAHAERNVHGHRDRHVLRWQHHRGRRTRERHDGGRHRQQEQGRRNMATQLLARADRLAY